MSESSAAGRPQSARLQIPAALERVGEAGAAVREAARVFGFDEDTCYALDIAIVEAMTNVIRHGEHPPQVSLEVGIAPRDDRLEISLRDRGTPIPAEALARADDSVFEFDPGNLEAIPEHGMGLALIRRIADELTYESGPQGNLLTLTRYATGDDGARRR